MSDRVSTTCERVIRWSENRIVEQCGRPSVWAYITETGWFAMCEGCAVGHERFSSPVSDILSGLVTRRGENARLRREQAQWKQESEARKAECRRLRNLRERDAMEDPTCPHYIEPEIPL